MPISTYPVSTPNKLRELRQLRGLKQEDIAKALSVNQVTVSQYESGRVHLTLEKAVALAKILKCDLNELAGLETESDIRGAQTSSEILNRLLPLTSLGIINSRFHDLQFHVLEDPFMMVELGINQVTKRRSLLQSLSQKWQPKVQKQFKIELFRYISSAIFADEVLKKQEEEFFSFISSAAPEIKADLLKAEKDYLGSISKNHLPSLAARRFIIWNIAIVSIVDGHFHDLESVYMHKVGKHFGLSKQDVEFIKGRALQALDV